jgi:hypothetical protein
MHDYTGPYASAITLAIIVLIVLNPGRGVQPENQ